MQPILNSFEDHFSDVIRKKYFYFQLINQVIPERRGQADVHFTYSVYGNRFSTSLKASFCQFVARNDLFTCKNEIICLPRTKIMWNCFYLKKSSQCHFTRCYQMFFIYFCMVHIFRDIKLSFDKSDLLIFTSNIKTDFNQKSFIFENVSSEYWISMIIES